MKALGIKGATSVIRVNGTRWISHVSQALRNFLHAYKAHVNTYNELQLADKYSSASKAQSVYFARKLSNRLFMEFAIYMMDVLSALSAFSKVSQERNVTCGDITDSLQKALTQLQQFEDNPDRGENWRKRDEILGNSSSVVLDVAVQKNVVAQLKKEISIRCNEVPPETDTIKLVLNPEAWKYEDFFLFSIWI